MSELEQIDWRTTAHPIEEPNGPGRGYLIAEADYETLFDAARRWDELTSETPIVQEAYRKLRRTVAWVNLTPDEVNAVGVLDHFVGTFLEAVRREPE